MSSRSRSSSCWLHSFGDTICHIANSSLKAMKVLSEATVSYTTCYHITYMTCIHIDECIYIQAYDLSMLYLVTYMVTRWLIDAIKAVRSSF